MAFDSEKFNLILDRQSRILIKFSGNHFVLTLCHWNVKKSDFYWVSLKTQKMLQTKIKFTWISLWRQIVENPLETTNHQPVWIEDC